MPEGQTPKIIGSICNVPIDTNDMTNVLPRGIDKLSFCDHVYFEEVSPGLLKLALKYLKDKNHLYV